MPVLIALAVILGVGSIVWLCYSISKKGQIVGKDEQSRAAIASYRAMGKKSEKVMRDAVEATALYLATFHKALKESRELIKGQVIQGSLSDSQTALQQIFEVYPKRTGEEVFTQFMKVLVKERDDVQYNREKANARIADYNELVKGPISHIVAKAMKKVEKTYLETADEPLLKELMSAAGKDLLFLAGGTEEKPEDWIRLDKEETEDSTEEGEPDG